MFSVILTAFHPSQYMLQVLVYNKLHALIKKIALLYVMTILVYNSFYLKNMPFQFQLSKLTLCKVVVTRVLFN